MINFNSKIARKVLSYFLLNPQSEMYLNEIARKFKVNRGNLSRKLTEWVKEGILIKNTKGNLSLYQVNKKYPFLREMKRIVQKSFGLEKELKQALSKVKGIKKAYIFGSYANNRLSAESDIDLFLIGSYDFLKAQEKIVELQSRFDREINTIDMTAKEFKEKKDEELIKDIFKNKYIQII